MVDVVFIGGDPQGDAALPAPPVVKGINPAKLKALLVAKGLISSPSQVE